MLLERNLKDVDTHALYTILFQVLNESHTPEQCHQRRKLGTKMRVRVKSTDSTYSSHCVEAFNSAALVKNTFISAEKFPVRQLLIAKFLQIIAVDSSNNL